MKRNVLEVVDELFRRRLLIPDINPDVPLVNYGLDSIRSIELIVELESVFGVHISDEQAASMRTLRDVANQVIASSAMPAGHGDSMVGVEHGDGMLRVGHGDSMVRVGQKDGEA